MLINPECPRPSDFTKPPAPPGMYSIALWVTMLKNNQTFLDKLAFTLVTGQGKRPTQRTI